MLNLTRELGEFRRTLVVAALCVRGCCKYGLF